MLVFLPQRLVFFATPKTGSTAIEGALRPHASIAFTDPPDLRHLSPGWFRPMIGTALERRYGLTFRKVALIREPIARLFSWYRYRQRPDIPDPENSTAGMSFDGFVQGYMAEEPPPPCRIGSQAKFMIRPDGTLYLSHVLAYENSTCWQRFLREQVHDALDFPVRNAAAVPARPELSAATERALRAANALEFRLHDAAARDGLLRRKDWAG